MDLNNINEKEHKYQELSYLLCMEDALKQQRMDEANIVLEKYITERINHDLKKYKGEVIDNEDFNFHTKNL